VAAPQRGGRHLWDWSFIEFYEMVLRAAWTVLGVRRSVPANQSLDERFFGSCRQHGRLLLVATLSRRRQIAADSDSRG